MDMVDDSVYTEFSFELFNDGSSVGSFDYISNVYDEAIFLGFSSDFAFDKVQIRESSADNTNEYFHFYTATEVSEPAPLALVPEPVPLALLGMGLALIGFSRKRKSR